MALVVSDQGEVETLSRILNKIATGNVVLRLYTNNETPDEDSVIGDFTDATAAGYAPITLTGATWTVATAAGTTTGSYPQQTFTFTGSETVYGYFITNLAVDKLLWAEIFAGGPFNIPGGGGEIKVTPKIELA